MLRCHQVSCWADINLRYKTSNISGNSHQDTSNGSSKVNLTENSEKLANFIPENSGLDTAEWGKSGRLTSGYLGTGLHPDSLGFHSTTYTSIAIMQTANLYVKIIIGIKWSS